MPGRLITLEGGEGAGKSTHSAFIADWLRQRGRTVVQTREPGGSPLAEAVRGLVLGDWPEGLDVTTELLLMYAARAAHLQATVRPALARDEDVVCDRFTDSSRAYQGAGKGVEARHFDALEQLVLQGLQPQLVLVLDLDPTLGLARARRRGEVNRFEQETLAFMQRVRAAFLQRAQREPARYAVVDASLPLNEVQTAIAAVLEQRL